MGSKMLLGYEELVDNTKEVQLQSSKAHLWLEKRSHKNGSQNIQRPKQHLEAALAYADVIMKADEKSFVKQVEEIKKKLISLTSLVVQSYDKPLEEALRTDYDDTFSALLELCEVLESDVKEMIASDLQMYQMTYYILLIGSILLISVVVLSFKFYIQERDVQKTILINQDRFASMGEMMGNIAHQWRQPLNALGLTIQKIGFYHERGMLDDEKLHKNLASSMVMVRNMSKTIDDFQNFFGGDSEKELFVLADVVTTTYHMVQSTFEDNAIKFTLEIEDKTLTLEGNKNEFSQVILNLLTNAKDALIDNKIASAYVKVIVGQERDKISIFVSDNGGGIDDEIGVQVFDPYFTTKEQGKGVGMGLYMSKTIIEDRMNGSLIFFNTDDGVCFRIEI